MSRQFEAGRCLEGHLSVPPVRRCPTCGREQTGVRDLREEQATVLTWTESTTTPSGVREPNRLAIVVFEVDGEEVRALGGTTGPVERGDTVEPVYVETLRDETTGIRVAGNQEWDGYRFQPVD